MAMAAAVLVALIGVATFELRSEFDRSRRLREAVEQSYETRLQIQRVFSLLQDAETGQRGYIITGDPRFLAPYNHAVVALDAQINRLAEMFEDDPRQGRELALLQRLALTKQMTLQRGVRLRQEDGAQAAATQVATGGGKAAMDAIRRVVDRMTRHEASALAELSRLSAERTARTERLVITLVALLLLIIGGAATTIARYIVTRRQLLDNVQATAARQQAIFDSAIDAVVTLNPSGSIESFNKAAERMFGYAPEALTRRDIRLLIPLAEQGEGSFLARLEASQGAIGGGIVRELQARRADGATFPVDVGLGIVQLPEGAQVVAAIRDISERRRIETMKSEFVSTVSHELRTPLTSIAGSLGLLAGGAAGALPARASRLIEIAHANSQRLVRLINDILDVEKLESGKMTLAMAPLDLREVAVRSIEGMKGFADSLGVAIDLAPGPAAPVQGDLDRLIQVVTNLLSNAAKFSPTGGKVAVSVLAEARVARLSVRDHGPGVPDAFRSRIFSKFAQADSSDTRAKGGTGLGLVIAREIAERHGGRLWFESAPGEGAVFHLDLPLASDAGSPPAEAAPRLLICENDASAAEALRQILEQDGFAADVAGTARAALAAAREQRYAAVLVDLHLPDADGVTLIRALRSAASTRKVPVVVISGDVARGRARGRSLEVLDWLEKPLEPERLRQAVARVIARGGARPLVLHVDDDRDILEVTRTALGEAAVDVVTADSLAAARRALAERKPDLLILDIGLPDGSGLDLLPELGDDASAIPVIIYSAQEMDADLTQRVEAVLTKSRTSLANLAKTVRRLTHVEHEGPE